MLLYKPVNRFAPNVRVIPETAITSSLIVRRIWRVPFWTTNSKEVDAYKRASLSRFCAMFAIQIKANY